MTDFFAPRKVGDIQYKIWDMDDLEFKEDSVGEEQWRSLDTARRAMIDIKDEIASDNPGITISLALVKCEVIEIVKMEIPEEEEEEEEEEDDFLEDDEPNTDGNLGLESRWKNL